MEWYLKCWRHYADFEGRARRTEFWMFVLFNVIAGIILSLISDVIAYLYSLAIFIPSLAVGARRLHDFGKSGWWLLIGLVPLIGWICLLVFYCTEGEEDKNDWGINPKDLPAKEQLK